MFPSLWASLVASLVKNLPTMQESQVRSLRWEDALEKGMATLSSILAWRIPDRGAWRATIHGVTESGTTERLTLSLFLLCTRKRKRILNL